MLEVAAGLDVSFRACVLGFVYTGWVWAYKLWVLMGCG